jgi:NAD(P)H-quinone oxidoreductase subunit 5
MRGHEERTTVGQLPEPANEQSRLPGTLTRLVWLLWVASLGALAVPFLGTGRLELAGVVAVDGLTAVLWVTVTFFSGIVHSYSRRYMAGSRNVDRFFGRVFAFTLVVMVLVAADSLLLFATAWLAMGLVMAGLVGHVAGWPQAQAAAALARRYFLASSALLAGALAVLWWTTGATTVSGVASAVETVPSAAVLVAAGALALAAMVQSALVPFHTWLLSSMTAPTPASALMHAGFVNAGGVLLVRFAPVVTVEPGVMLAIALVGAASALAGKLLKSVQTDVKSKLGCSTSGQMGFMLMQAGLGFFGAAIAHLLLHGFYKAYSFLASGSRVAHEHPGETNGGCSTGAVGYAVTAVTALAGGILFAVLTGKGMDLGGGLLITVLVTLPVMHTAREVTAQRSAPAAVRYGAVALVALPALTLYALVYRAVEGALAGLPAVGQSVELTAVHALVTVAFVVAYFAVESGVYRHSRRLYAVLVNASQPASDTLLTTTEEYDEY